MGEESAFSDIPGPVLALGDRIANEGGELHIVGGWVRDRLMGGTCTDIDLATDLAPEKVAAVAEGLGNVYRVGEKFGTIGVAAGEYHLEVTTFRTERYTPGSRHPVVSFVAGLEEDLSRRDFTVNAMALSIAPERGELNDPFGGRDDIERRVIRTPGDPLERMREDPLRMMRAARFAAQLRFEVDPGLLGVLEGEAGTLSTIPMERRRDELERTIVARQAALGLRLLADTGLLVHVVPEVAATVGVDQPRAYHRADVFEHTLLTIEYLPPVALLRRAALLHDVGKPGAKVTSPKTMFLDHEKAGEVLAREAMSRLRYGGDDIRRTVFLVRHHMRPIRYESGWSDAAVRRLIRDCTMTKDGEVVVGLEAVMELARADIRAGNEEKVPVMLAAADELESRIASVLEVHDVPGARSPLDGAELMAAFGRGGGPWLRKVKERLVELVVAGELDQDDKEGALRLVRGFLDETGSD